MEGDVCVGHYNQYDRVRGDFPGLSVFSPVLFATC